MFCPTIHVPYLHLNEHDARVEEKKTLIKNLSDDAHLLDTTNNITV